MKKLFSADSNTARSSMTCLSPTTKKSLFLTAGDGCRLHALLFPVQKSRKAVIISHGIKWSLFGGYKYVELFQSIGYNVLLCDSRCHGLSGGSHVSYGFYEKDDLARWADELENRFGKDLWIGVLGESLGAAAAIEPDETGSENQVLYCRFLLQRFNRAYAAFS